ncbi:hypothetical protein EVAR_18764_1 [Eumeta japonica]|uniref:Uncharacterized protein n=1 Tax=Eumeta variegata TaxID=151549 RepID=A0A4C1UML6_EUMVA|nr:hypothetical protein EVAR_18764_1 [Eumeta japonica]
MNQLANPFGGSGWNSSHQPVSGPLVKFARRRHISGTRPCPPDAGGDRAPHRARARAARYCESFQLNKNTEERFQKCRAVRSASFARDLTVSLRRRD